MTVMNIIIIIEWPDYYYWDQWMIINIINWYCVKMKIWPMDIIIIINDIEY